MISYTPARMAEHERELGRALDHVEQEVDPQAPVRRVSAGARDAETAERLLAEVDAEPADVFGLAVDGQPVALIVRRVVPGLLSVFPCGVPDPRGVNIAPCADHAARVHRMVLVIRRARRRGLA